jgi:hypothetical protein
MIHSALLFATVLAVLLPTAAALLKILDDALLLDAERVSLRQRFEDWWIAVSSLSPHEFSVALAGALSRILDRSFGEDLVSHATAKRVLWICAVSALVCWASLWLFGHRDDDGLHPFQTYGEALRLYEKQVSDQLSHPEKYKLSADTVKANTAIQPIAKVLAKPYVLVAIATALVALKFLLCWRVCLWGFRRSRTVLREIAAIKRPNATRLLLWGHLWALILAATFLMEMYWVLTEPIGLFAVLIGGIFGLAKVWGMSIWVILSGALAGWEFASLSSVLLTAVAMAPLIASGLVIVCTWFAVRRPHAFHRTAAWLLFRCAVNGPIKVLTGALLGLSAVATCVREIYAHIHR